MTSPIGMTTPLSPTFSDAATKVHEDSCATTLWGASRAPSLKGSDMSEIQAIPVGSTKEAVFLPILSADCLPAPKRYYMGSLRSSDYFIALVVGFTFLVAAAVFGLFTPIIPFQLERMGRADAASLTSYLASAYAGGVATAPVSAFLARIIPNRRWLLLAMVAIIALSDVIVVVRSDYATLVASRILQGVGTAGIWVAAVTLLLDNVAISRAGRLLGASTFGYAIGNTASQPIGGLLFTRLGWRSVAFLGIGLCTVNAGLLLLYVEKKHIRQVPTSPTEVTPEVTAEAETRAEGLCQCLKLLVTNPRHVVTLFVTIWYALSMSGMVTAGLSLRLAQRYQLDAQHSSLTFLAISLPAGVSGPFAGYVTDRFGARSAMAALLVASVLWAVVASLDVLPYAAFVTALVGTGLAHGFATTPTLVYMANVDKVSPTKIGTDFLYGAWNFCYAAGALIFPLIAGRVMNAAGVSVGWKVITGTVAGVGSVALLLVLKYIHVLPTSNSPVPTIDDEKEGLSV